VRRDGGRALRFLTECSVWVGRYPIPVAAERLNRLTTGQKLRLRGAAHIDYVFDFGHRLADQLAVLLDKEHEAGENTRLREELARRPDEG